MKSIFHSLIIIAACACLFGCGNAERHEARQKFKEKVAALKVSTQGATYSEFRQAEMDLKTSFEVNKKYLGDLNDDFAYLEKLMTATDLFFYVSTQNPRHRIHPNDASWQYVVFLSPEMEKKSNYTDDQIEGMGRYIADPDFLPKNHVGAGLTKIADRTEVLLNSLDNRK